ncbi:ComEC family competence protein [Rhodovulum iodosum]|nr:ComEC/Rec2 family competence protein [Rhodovulum robiginosum]RSK35934.1 ComEC family competence protein [Rhodovulum robiginosum]
MLGLGIGAYFALGAEPPVWALWAAAWGAAALGLGAWRWAAGAGPALAGLALVLAGLALAGARAHLVAAPVLEHRFYGGVAGRVVALDRSLSDAPRVTLDRVWLQGVDPARTPARVRLSLHGSLGLTAPVPGTRVMATAHLSPPAAPAEPGGFDFRRHAWFQRLGAVGYTRAPMLALAPPAKGPALVVARWRMALSEALRERMPGARGAVAAAILTGDRSAIARETLDDLRHSNLAHLLAISGLHMGLLTGFVFAALRYGLAMIPPLALRVPVKRIAALGALAVGAGYLALAGGNVATQRAFVMVAVVLGAVLADRRALTLRAVALAALIVLVRAPESLTQAGFQMSFAATTALVAVFAVLRDAPGGRWHPPRWARAPMALVVSSAVAGAATAPFGAAHFNQMAQYGLLANLLSVPLMGAVVIPSAVLAGLLSPLGLEALGLVPMGLGLGWILGVADRVAGMDGAVWPVMAPGRAVLPLISGGMLWLMLWQGRARWGGLVPVAAAFVLWSGAERPPLLVAESGRLIGVMTGQGRALSNGRGSGFVARSWLENDGDLATQEAAAARAGLPGGAARIGGLNVIQIAGRGWQERLASSCRDGAVLIVGRAAEAPPGAACTVLDSAALAQSGALAIYPEGAGLRTVAARAQAGDRLWTRPAQ